MSEGGASSAGERLDAYIDALLGEPSGSDREPARASAAVPDEPGPPTGAPVPQRPVDAEADAVYNAMLEARARLDHGADARSSGTCRHRCIAFRVADELYAVDLGAVREVIVPPEAVPVPGAASEVLGVINLRGSVVTVLNSRVMLGLAGCPDESSARILILDDGRESVGVLVDAVDDIVLVDPAEVDRSASLEPGATRLHVRGALTVGEQIAFLVELAALTGTAPAE